MTEVQATTGTDITPLLQPLQVGQLQLKNRFVMPGMQRAWCVDGVPRRTRPLLRPCMDWTERRHHLAGGLGAAVATELTRRDWVRRQEGSRIVAVTPAGYEGLDAWLGIDFGRLRADAAA